MMVLCYSMKVSCQTQNTSTSERPHIERDVEKQEDTSGGTTLSCSHCIRDTGDRTEIN